MDDARCRFGGDASASAPAIDDGTGEGASVAWWGPARQALLRRLRNSPDGYANAVAAWLDVGDAPDPRTARESRLAALASSTRDPRVYGLAMRTCWHRISAPCQSLSARRWSELDPDNALPWLMMMDDAMALRDVSGAQEAMYRATHARSLDLRMQAPVQVIVDAATDDPASLMAARSLGLYAMGLAAAQPEPVQAMLACFRVTSANANAWQQCADMTDLLERRSDSLFARRMGASLDLKRTGDKRAVEEFDVLTKRQLQVDVMTRSSGCTDLRGQLDFMRRLAVDGEVAAMRSLGG